MGTTITLIVVGVILIAINIRAINKEKNSFRGVLKDKESNMEDFQVEIGKLRREFAETLLELQTQIVDFEKKLDSKKTLIVEKDEDNELENNNEDNELEDDIEKGNQKESGNEINNIKVKQIEKFLDQGKTLEEIADILKIGKGEILLIEELYLK